MNLKDILSSSTIRIPLEHSTKNEIIEEMVDILYQNGKISAKDKIIRAIFDREKLMSTGIGDGVAIPHAKADGIDKISVAFGITKNDLDFQSLDQKPVKLIFLLVGPLNQPGPHLKALSRISRLLHQKEFRTKLLEVTKPEEALQIIMEEEENYFNN